MPTRTTAPLSTHDPVLGPVAKAHRNSPADITVLALACRALDAGIPPSVLRVWCLSRCPGPVATLARDRRRFGHLVATARQRVARVSSPDGRAAMRLAAARRIVGCLVSPAPEGLTVSTRRQVRARAAFAVLAAQFLEAAGDRGFDTIVLGAPALAVNLGCTEATARSALDACVEMGMLRKMPSRKGAPPRWKLPTRLTGGRSQIAWAHADLVEALVGDTTTPWNEVLAAVSHAAIAYGSDPVGHHAWLVGLCDAASVDPGEVGMTAKTVAAFRHRWESVPDLHEHAQATGAYAGKAAAEEERQQAVERRRVEILLSRYLATHPIPDPGLPQSVREPWRHAITTDFSHTAVFVERPSDLAGFLAKRLERAGYEPARAAAASRAIAGIAA